MGMQAEEFNERHAFEPHHVNPKVCGFCGESKGSMFHDVKPVGPPKAPVAKAKDAKGHGSNAHLYPNFDPYGSHFHAKGESHKCPVAVNQGPNGRHFITMGHAGFNSPTNNGSGYASHREAVKAIEAIEKPQPSSGPPKRKPTKISRVTAALLAGPRGKLSSEYEIDGKMKKLADVVQKDAGTTFHPAETHMGTSHFVRHNGVKVGVIHPEGGGQHSFTIGNEGKTTMHPSLGAAKAAARAAAPGYAASYGKAMKKLSDSGAVIEKRKTRSDKGGHHKHKVGGMEFTSAHLPSMDDGETEMHGVYHNGKQIGSVEHYQGKHYAHSMHGNIGPGGKRMRSGAYDPRHPFESHEKAVEAIGLHHIHGEKIAAQLRAEHQKRAEAKEHERVHGNENTGDISGLHEHMHVTGVDGNWVNGTTKDGRHSIAMKVFSEPSDYGINRGRVSTLTVKNGKWGEPGGDHVNYDRGWDVKPSSEEHKQLVRGITNALKSKSVKKSDDGRPEELDTDPCEYVAPSKEEQPNG